MWWKTVQWKRKPAFTLSTGNLFKSLLLVSPSLNISSSLTMASYVRLKLSFLSARLQNHFTLRSGLFDVPARCCSVTRIPNGDRITRLFHTVLLLNSQRRSGSLSPPVALSYYQNCQLRTRQHEIFLELKLEIRVSQNLAKLGEGGS